MTLATPIEVVNYRAEIYGKLEGSELRMPRLAYLIFNPKRNTSVIRQDEIDNNSETKRFVVTSNELNEQVFKDLTDNDTLAIRQDWLIFK